MSLYQQYFSFKGIIFTNSNDVGMFAESLNITVFPIKKRSKFRMPVIKEMLNTMRNQYQSKFYGYMNSDILLHYRVFSLLPLVTKRMKSRKLPANVELASRVTVVDSDFHITDFSSLESCRSAFDKKRMGYLRSNVTAVRIILICDL